MRKLVQYTCAAALGIGLAVAAAGGAQAQQKVSQDAGHVARIADAV